MKYKYRQGRAEYFNGYHPDKRDLIVTKFQKPEVDESPPVRFLVGTCVVMGFGYTMTMAFRAFIIQPEWMQSDEEQAKGRIWRTTMAQHALKTYMYRPFIEGFSPEQIIIARHDARGFISNEVGTLKDEEKDDFFNQPKKNPKHSVNARGDKEAAEDGSDTDSDGEDGDNENESEDGNADK